MYSAVDANKRNTVIIMAVFVGFIAGLAWLVSTLFFKSNIKITLGVTVAALLYALIQYFIASRVALSLMGAQEITKDQAPEYYRVVENLAITAGMPMPKVTIIDDPAPNAFATGRDPKHAVVGITTGLLEVLDKRELTAVMAHEMSHVRNYDIRVTMISVGLVSVVGVISDLALNFMLRDRDNDTPIWAYIIGVVLVMLAPLAAALIQLAIGRQREYLADASGALLTRDSEGMASALEKIQQFSRPMEQQSTVTSSMFLANPFKEDGLFARMFSTHPPLGDRIKRLRSNADKF